MTARVAHLIVGLDVGGAEKMLLSLVEHRDPQDQLVVSMTGGGTLLPDFLRTGARVESLGMRRGLPDPRAFARFRRLLAEHRPDVVQTWMYHADLLGGLAARSIPVVWSIHAVDIERSGLRMTTRVTRALCARLSGRLPGRIVYCAESAARFHRSLGYASDKAVLIPNGVDVARFVPDETARGVLLEELGLPEGTELVGNLARFHPQKDHRTLARAAGLLLARRPQAHLVLCGRGVDDDNEMLVTWLREEGVYERSHLLGERADTPKVLAALDVLALASAFGEAAPVVVMEAMSCGTPCVVTDVGDSARIVGESGIVVPPRRPEALAHALESCLATGPVTDRTSSDARRRAIDYYSISSCADAYEKLYQEIAE